VRRARLDEPLAASAALGLSLAAERCYVDPVTGERCDWYHGPWQLLRLMGLVITPGHHAEFFRTAIEDVAARTRAPRVLVSGAADYSMLAHVLAALEASPGRPEITVVDVCDTPLLLSEWYAERVGHPIRTYRSDILEFRDDRPFDAICTHAFLGRFPAADRPKLLARWKESLGPGGVVITVNRIQPAASDGRNGFAPEQGRAFRERVLAGAEALRPTVPSDPVRLAHDVDRYVARQGAYHVRAREELLGLFEEAGLVVDRASWGAIPAASQHALSGPGIPIKGEYGRIVARRP
jgi:SAM-dependent methyltransferase